MTAVPVGGGTAPAPTTGAGAVVAPGGRARRVVVAVLGAAPLVEIALGFAVWFAGGRTARQLFEEYSITAGVVAVGFGAIGAVAVDRRPGHRLGLVLLAIGHTEALAVLLGCVAGTHGAGSGPVVAWLAGWIWLPGWVATAALLPPLFPDGQPPSRAWSLLAAAGAACVVAVTAVVPFSSRVVPTTPVPAPARWQGPLEAVALAGAFGSLLVGGLGACGLAVRAARTTGPERRRILWFFTGFVVAMLGSTLPLGNIVQLAATAAFPLAIGIAMLRYGLFDADRLLSRTLVHTALGLLVAAVVAASIAASITWSGGSGPGAVAAAVVVTLGLAPARDAVQRSVDRLLYGGRRDPYAAMTGLARELSVAVAPADMLAVVAGTVTRALRLPYAAISVGDEPVPAAAAGRPTARTVDLPLRHAGERVGTLTVGLRDRAPALDADDERLLADVARQAGSVAHTVRLTHDLRLAYDRLETARDEERHRIRRDLHDQLGPLLAGVVLGLGAARRAAAGRPDEAALLARLQAQAGGGLDDVKRLVAGLGPSALDETGLVAALQRHAELLSGAGAPAARVAVTAGELPALPAELEVAAYRICLEAVSNAVRHGRARAVGVCLQVQDDVLHLRVEDDGVGLPDDAHRRGLGLASMAARARDVGGTWAVTPGDAGGTVVSAALPLTRAETL